MPLDRDTTLLGTLRTGPLACWRRTLALSPTARRHALARDRHKHFQNLSLPVDPSRHYPDLPLWEPDVRPSCRAVRPTIQQLIASSPHSPERAVVVVTVLSLPLFTSRKFSAVRQQGWSRPTWRRRRWRCCRAWRAPRRTTDRRRWTPPRFRACRCGDGGTAADRVHLMGVALAAGRGRPLRPRSLAHLHQACCAHDAHVLPSRMPRTLVPPSAQCAGLRHRAHRQGRPG